MTSRKKIFLAMLLCSILQSGFTDGIDSNTVFLEFPAYTISTADGVVLPLSIKLGWTIVKPTMFAKHFRTKDIVNDILKTEIKLYLMEMVEGKTYKSILQLIPAEGEPHSSEYQKLIDMLERKVLARYQEGNETYVRIDTLQIFRQG